MRAVLGLLIFMLVGRSPPQPHSAMSTLFYPVSKRVNCVFDAVQSEASPASSYPSLLLHHRALRLVESHLNVIKKVSEKINWSK